jgi:PqqD family protein of HPr-rel-A system
MRLREDIRVSFRPDGAALMDPRSGNLFALNTSASVIVQGLHDGHDSAHLAGMLVAQYGLEQAEALTFVERIVGQCRTAGLLSE